MTQEELVTQAESLYNIGKYSEVISLIQSLPEEQKTYHLLYLLALAYSDNLEGDDDYNQHCALKILKQISDQGEFDLKWLYLTGKVYFTMSQEEYAIEYFDKIGRIVQKDKDIAELMNMQHFVDSCRELLFDRALAVIFVVLKEASKDDKMTICNIDDNKIELLFPKYNIHLNMEISHMHRSGARLSFEIMYPDDCTKKYCIDGDSTTYENGIADALNRFASIINKEFREHCKIAL